MEALPADWQSLLRISPADINADNEDEVDNNEQLGLKFVKVSEEELVSKSEMKLFCVAQSGCTQ